MLNMLFLLLQLQTPSIKPNPTDSHRPDAPMPDRQTIIPETAYAFLTKNFPVPFYQLPRIQLIRILTDPPIGQTTELPKVTQNSCYSFFKKLIDTIDSQNFAKAEVESRYLIFSKTQQKFLDYSGNGTIDLGNWMACMAESENSNHLLVTATAVETRGQPVMSGYIGLCLPKDCTAGMQAELIDAKKENFSFEVNSEEWTDSKEGKEYFGKREKVKPEESSWLYELIDGTSRVQEILSRSYDFGAYLVFFIMGGATILVIKNSIIYSLARRKTYAEITSRNLNWYKNFDMWTNLNSAVRSSRPNAANQVLELLRFCAMIWIIFSHEPLTKLDSNNYKIDMPYYKRQVEGFYLGFVESGFMAIEVFLFLSGMVNYLSINSYMKRFDQNSLGTASNARKNCNTYVFLVIKRVIRLQPTLLIVSLWFNYVRRVGKPNAGGGFKNSPDNSCSASQILWSMWLIQNPATTGGPGLCIGWAWYIYVDFILFLSVPQIVFFSRKYGRRWGINQTKVQIAGNLVFTVVALYLMEARLINIYDINSWEKHYPKWYFRSFMYHLGCYAAQRSLIDQFSDLYKKIEPKVAELQVTSDSLKNCRM